MNNTYAVIDDFKIQKMRDGRFAVFAANRFLDQFTSFHDAAKLTRELSIAKHASAHPEEVGALKFMASADNGSMFVVIDRTPSGVIVQRVGEPHYRAEVSPKELSDPLAS